MIATLETLEDVLAWGLARSFDVVEVIVQDEYTHDVVMRGDVWYVFDTT
jgi:uncharacterized ferritin-like protein (DUF455 family)